MRSSSRISAFLLFVALTGTAASQVATGVPAFNSFGGGSFDTINLGDLNVHLQIPIINKAGRGMSFWYLLSYDNSMWVPGSVNGQAAWVQATTGGWTPQSNGLTGTLASQNSTSYCYGSNGQVNGTTTTVSFTYRDPQGTSHYWANVWTMISGSCSGSNVTSYTGTNGDGSGLTLTAIQGSPSVTYVSTSDGTILQPSTLVQDRNGNQITSNGSGTFYDTLNTSTAVLTVANAASSSDPSYNSETDYTYQAPAGPATIKVFSNNVTLQANFGCGYAASPAQSSSLVQKILFPDGSYYLFGYEATNGAPSGYYTGRITSVQLPTGGTISYSYTGGSNGVICADGSAAGITRITPDDASQGQHWTYSRSGSGSSWTTTMTDPASSTTTINFSGLYETQRVLKDSGNNTLATVVTCYNGQTNPSVCPTAPVNGPITQKNVFTQPGGSSVYSEVQYSFNTLGLLTDEYDYDYFNGSQYPALRHTHTDFASLGNNIYDRPSQVSIYDGGGTLKAQTKYTYDEYTSDANGHAPLQSTSSPQHIGVSGSRGNATTVSRLVSGTTYLSSYITYFDTGNVQNNIDVNGATTTYAYGACGNAFPSSVAEPLNLSRSMAWDCNGGVMTSLTDENGKLTTNTYSNPYFYRVDSTKDALLNQTSFTYGANPPTTVESAMSFNGGLSTSDALNTADSLGRPMLSQKRQAPGSSNFDSVETDYDVLGRATRQTLSYSATAGAKSSTAPAVTTTYDALNRPTQVNDAGGGYTSYSYSANSTTVTVGPAASNETTKQRKLIYDGLGRLIQVNEPSPISPATGSSGSVTVNGSEQQSTHNATPGTGSVTISGSESSVTINGCPNSYPYNCWYTVYDSGNVSITVNGVTDSASYGSNDTGNSVASGLANAINGDGSSPVTASASGSTVYLTAKSSGSGTNYSLSASSATQVSQYFSGPSFWTNTSGSTLTGGTNASTSYDSGTVSITVNGATSSASYGQGSTNSSLAASLANAVNANSPYVTASASGNVITLASKTTGSGTNYSLSASSSSGSGFSPPSFTTSSSGSSLTGGTDQSGGLLSPYQTLYSYDALGNLTGVTQNAQAPSSSQQTRSYSYDGLGRLTSETNPESGTTTYTYDSVAANYCASSSTYTSAGDLVAKSDANGNHVCYYYDSLHRLTDVGNNNQSVTNACRRFRYDNSQGLLGSIPTGITVANTKGRMVEAATDTCAWPPSQSTIITDEWFSYSARGEVTDVYESTPHSGGYYHVNTTYWANGAVDQLNGIPGVPAITYAPDGEGRINTVSAASGQNPVTATTYNVASLPTAVTFGSADSDSFIYDGNTNRLTQYKFTVNGQSVIGSLTWNANGSLNQLGITDPFNSANQQTCAYGTDQLARINSVSCGSTWSQTFSYDAFGNVSKSGSSAWVASYSTATNHITSVGGFGPSYDNDGNLTNDSAHTYSWNVHGNAASIDSVTLTYDAQGRTVEQNRSGAYTEILYGPNGSKLALLNGQTLNKAFVALPGRATAVYSSSGLSYYRHSDWLGSSRFASTAGRAMYYDGAYAPFGESYSETGTTDRSFTGQNQDTVGGLYDFLYREHSPAQGRWISPDPAGRAAADLTNPQSLNRYAYLVNNPLALVDGKGLGPCDALIGAQTGGEQVWCNTSQIPDYYQASYGGPPPNPGPGCWTAWCPGGPNGEYWNEPNPDEAALGEAAYAARVDEIFWGNYWDSQEGPESSSADGGSPQQAPDQQPSCGTRLANGVQQHTGTTISNVQYIGSIGGHANYSFDVPDPAAFQSILNQNMPWSWAGPLDRGHRYGAILSTHLLDPTNGAFSGHTDLFSAHSIFLPLHVLVDVAIGHIPGVNLDFGCRAN